MSERRESEKDGGLRADGRESEFRSILGEVALLFGVTFVVVAGVSVAAEFVPVIGRYLYVIVAVVFLGVPYGWIEWNGWRFRRFGLVFGDIWGGLGWGLGCAALTAAPFAVGYWIWETRFVGASYSFEWSNFRKWDPELEGAPSEWGERPGIWVWTDERAVRAGIRAAAGGRGPVTVRIDGDRPFGLEASGADRIRPTDPGSERAETWHVTVRAEGGRAELEVAPRGLGAAGFPTSLEWEVTRGAAAHPIRAGPGARPVDGDSYGLDRGLRWIYLWLMTQLLFIALPEEYFYRGYLQTRIGEALRSYRRAGADPGATTDGRAETRSWFGVTEENLAASGAFGIGHLLTPVGGAILWNRVAVAFPSVVFGWLRDRTGSITASVVYHAACNMLVLLVEPHFF